MQAAVAAHQKKSLLELPDLTIAMLSLALDDDSQAGIALATERVQQTAGAQIKDGAEAPVADGQAETGSSNLTSKTAPGVVFASRQELAEHNRSDWHRLNLKRLAAGLEAVAEAEFQRIVSDLEDGASISGSDTEASEDDDDDEFRNIIEAQVCILRANMPPNG
jgi:hypothetical protein